MNKDLKLPHDGMVLVSDGRKALFLKNRGDDVFPNYQVDRVLQAENNPQTREQGADKPGTRGERHTIAQTDWHDQAERKFANEVADAINVVGAAAAVKAIVVAAPPRTLAQLRTHFSDAVKQKILAEVNKDLTKHPVFEIEQHLTGRA
ncbi:host attachment protein [Microvirga sp. KLBC 81]|uniref:host attachment protein n=1 Tax=Microvirga sp. KLBC 81 TaxID=1862707 RepID=UPI001FDF6BEA|nr:host attachment protein [Microvirga sp. KLBC 81]